MALSLEKEINKRIQEVQDYIIESGCDACIISSTVNLYYLRGEIFDGYMFIQPYKDPIYFIKRPLNIKGANIEFIRKPEQILELLPKYNIDIPKCVLLENDVMSFNFISRLQNALGTPKINNISGFLRGIRSLKSENELELIRHSAKIHAEVYKKIPSLYKSNMTDLDLQIEIEYLMRKNNSIGFFRSFGQNMDIFMGSLLAGDNAEEPSPFDFALGGKGVDPLLPLGSANTLLEIGTSVMVDMAGNYSVYLSDMSRTFSLGKLPREAIRAHQLSIDIHNHLMTSVKEGVMCSEVYKSVMKMVRKNNLEDYFMGTKQQAKFIGHGVGLEINEPPVFAEKSKDILKKNMVIALEPKFVFPKIGAVGIENTYIVNNTDLEKITICEEEIIELN